MKILFLDFDGVLNSRQEVQYHNRLWNKKSNVLARIKDYLHKLEYKMWQKLPSGSRWRDKFTKFALKHLSDHEDFCPIACSNLQFLLEKFPDLMVVVSSVWRGRGLKYVQDVLKRNEIDPKRVIGVTPSYGEEMDGSPSKETVRGHQIQAWLNKHPEVGVFAIVDDDSDMAHLIGYLAKTNNSEGLMWRQVKKLMSMLGACEYCEAVGRHEKFCTPEKRDDEGRLVN